MSVASKAVFLSYAHEDAATARRLAEAMRAAGVEVWFDQSELRGGDAWDAKIRKQIKDCGLFVPVVSANTQARREGYFRLEWRLADQRTHLMGKNTTFIVPVCLDTTPDEEADVPDSFLKVQWTRFPVRKDANGKIQKEPDELDLSDFAGFLKQLLAAGDLQFTPAPFNTHPAPDADPALPPLPVEIVSAPPKRGWPQLAAIAAMILVCAVVAYLALRPKSETPAPPPQPVVETKSSPAAEPALGPKSIAVLPFEYQSDDQDTNAFFADGVHEDIITNLTYVRDLRVVPRTSLLRYRGTTKTAREIGQELGAAYVLSGTVRRSDGKVRVTTALIVARTDEQLWAKPYLHELKDIFALQSSLATDIATSLRAAISPQIQRILDRKLTTSPEAYAKYVQGREIRIAGYPVAGGVSGRDREQHLFEEAVALDPNFAVAWAWLANNYAFAQFDQGTGKSDPEKLARAKTAIANAVRLAPDDPDVILNRGYVHYYENRDFARAVQYFEQVGQIQPNGAFWRFALGTVQRRQGRWPEALMNLRRATEIEPANADFSNVYMTALVAARRYDEFRAEHERRARLVPDPLVDRFHAARTSFMAAGSTAEVEAFFAAWPVNETPESLRALRTVWNALLSDPADRVASDSRGKSGASSLTDGMREAQRRAAQGDWAENRRWFSTVAAAARQRLAGNAKDAQLWVNLARVEALMGNKEEALRCAQRAVDLLPESLDRVDGVGLAVRRALIYVWTGDKDRALAEYARLLQTPGPHLGGDINVHLMRRDERLEPLHGDPRFEALLNDPKNNQPLF